MEPVAVYFKNLGIRFDISSMAFKLGPVEVHWYGILIATGVVLALLYAMRMAKPLGLNSDRMMDVIIGGIVGGVLGARIYYVVFSFSEFKDDFWRIFRIWEGGLAFYGAVIGGFLVGWLVCKWRKVNVRDMLDLGAMGFLIGQGIGRWGNFFNQEAFGTNTDGPFGMFSEKTMKYLLLAQSGLAEKGMTVNPSLPVHPTFLYESVWCLLGVLVLHMFIKRRVFKGQIVLMYGVWYGSMRIFTENLRTDSLYIGSFKVSFYLSILIVAVSLILLILGFTRAKRKPPVLAAETGTVPLSVEQEEKKKETSVSREPELEIDLSDMDGILYDDKPFPPQKQ